MSDHTRITFADGNHGFQVGQNSGPITTNFNLSPERPETPPKPTSTVPFRRDADFVERGDLLQRIEQVCSGPASRAALVGLGGVGKSQLAIEHTYRQDIWLFWVHASTKARIQESFKTIADVLRLSGRNQLGANILELVERWLSNEHNVKWFMVLDSADDLNVFYDTKVTGQISSPEDEKRSPWTYLPQSPNGSILITTRNRELASRLTGNYKNVIDVGPMDPSHALTLLATKCGDGLDMDAGPELVKELEFIPLAISQAAAYIQQRWPRSSVTKYLDDFRKTSKNKSSLLDFDAGDLRRDRSASNSIITTCQISFDHIRSERQSAMDLLSLMSFFDCRSIPDYLIYPDFVRCRKNEEDTYSEEDTTDDWADFPEDPDSLFEDDIITLRKYCLIKTNETSDNLGMHSLVQLSVAKWLAAHGKTETFKQAYLSRMFRAFRPGEMYENSEMCRGLFVHHWVLLLYKGGNYAVSQGRYTTARKMAEEALAANEKVCDDTVTLSLMNSLSLNYSRRGRWKEAEELQLRAVEGYKRLLGLEHPTTLGIIQNLTWVYMKAHRWKEVEEAQLQILEICQRLFGADNPDTLNSMKLLAITWELNASKDIAESWVLSIIGLKKHGSDWTICVQKNGTTIKTRRKAIALRKFWIRGHLKSQERRWEIRHDRNGRYGDGEGNHV
ncbi:hypothetical protein K449DRAFT_404982 [Hypoxylon sp. EC38]|nr:hypothetical protein K449DRAFT_404982 [Hypoxylon sp. EC38]